MVASSTRAAERERLHRRARRLEVFTVGWNVLEALVAITAGLLAGSVALLGFGVDSAIEVMAAAAVLWRLRRAGAHASREETFHAEGRALYVVSASFFLLAAYIAYEATTTLVQADAPETTGVGLVLAAVSLVVMPVLAWWKTRTGKEMDSHALRADAIETWVCAYLSAALLAGVGLYLAFGWAWADPVAALAMLPVIVWQGREALREARGHA